MRTRFFFPLLPLLFATAPAITGCGTIGSIFGDGDDDDCSKVSSSDPASLGPEPKEPGGIHGFGSEAELETYLAAAKSRQQAAAGSSKCKESAPAMSAGAPAPEADGAGSTANENVTNNQEAGVDEGGIVKNVGDHLVVLRQGRLYAVDVADGRAPALSDSIRVARTDALNSSVWYDEMLVKGDLVYVVGYRYGIQAPLGSNDASVRGATEIDTFRLTNGKLTRLKSMFLESNDYYSGHNYASRMVGGKLVFYMPHYIGWHGDKLAYPRVLTADDDGVFHAVGPIFGALDVSTSLTKPHYPTFHTVVQCDLPDTGELACHGRSVIGSAWRENYVSSNAAYVWASSHVYRFDFDSLDVSSHAAQGHPFDQFSFRETQDKLLVAVNGSTARRDGSSAVGPAMLSLPLAQFDKTGEQTAASTSLRDKGFLAKNRFIGDVLVAAIGDSVSYPGYNGVGGSPEELVALDPAKGILGRTTVAGVTRLEPLGDGRVLVVVPTPTTDDEQGGVSLNAYAIDGLDAPLSRIVLPGVSQGEGRSHGFFFRPDAAGGGTMGYAVVSPAGSASKGWGNGISNLGFFDVTPAGALSTLGIISAGEVDTQCETSCVDWYGNTRPIFLRQRAFALMGSELAEIETRPEAKRVGQAVILSNQ